tara:strand:+ start:50 stop:328 length:279 start_codon:yes stop_codon:yes gene_type:complete
LASLQRLNTEVDEMAIFGREVIGREVMDRTGVHLGSLTDIHFDLKTGSISELIVTVEPSVSAAALPFESNENTVTIPADAVSRIGTQIHLNK